jgi:hypothetical protein
MSRPFVALFVTIALSACSGTPDADADTAAARGVEGVATTDTSPGSVAAAGGAAAGPEGSLPANRDGRIAILEYHLIGDRDSEWMVERGRFKRHLQLLYDRGYRPITVAQLLDKDFSDVPPGMSPVVFTFDDASPVQFSYLERNGELEIDPNSVVGIWTDFNRRNPDWKNRATFCLLSGAGNGHAFFGDNPKWAGQKREWRHQKVRWLHEQGFELCNHTLWHAQLSKYPDAVVQEQIARGQLAIDSAVPGYKVRTFALPQGLWPKNRELAWRGSWTDPKTGQTVRYNNETVLEVSGGPTRSPYDAQFDPRRLPRFIVNYDNLEKLLDRFDRESSRFVVGR